MKKSFLKVLCFMVIITLFATVFTACGNEEQQQQTTTAQSSSAADKTEETKAENKEPVEIKVWSDLQNLDAGFQEAFNNFMKENPDVKINLTHYPSDADKYPVILKTAIQANEAPDLFRTNGWNALNDYVKMNATMDLTGKVDVSKFDKGFLQASTIDGKLYSTPGLRKDILTVFYNKDIFEKNGLAIPKSYDEFVSVCDKLMSAGIIPIAYSGKETVSNIFAAYTIGPSILTPQWYDDAVAGKTNFKDERFIKMLSIIKEFGDKGYYGKLFKGVPFDGAKLSFQQGKAAMIFDGSWDNGAFKETKELKYGAFFFPPLKAGDPVVGAMFNEAGFSVYSETKNTDAALKVANFLSSQSFYETFCVKNTLVSPLTEIKVEDPVFADFATADQWMLFYFPHFNKAEPSPQTKLMEGLQASLFGKKTVEQVADEIQAVVDKDFPEFKK